jgi:UDP-3-O-[3-hydroxymyristoyl] glucosamine N-acyltransferase
VRVARGVGVSVALGVAVGDGVAVADGVALGVCVTVGLGVAVGVGVLIIGALGVTVSNCARTGAVPAACISSTAAVTVIKVAASPRRTQNSKALLRQLPACANAAYYT